MCLDSMLTTHHERFRKLSSKSLQGVGKIYTVFSARSSRGICGAAAKADIRLHSETHIEKKKRVSLSDDSKFAPSFCWEFSISLPAAYGAVVFSLLLTKAEKTVLITL